MNGFERNNYWPASLPGSKYYIFDRDVIIDFENNKFTFLVTVPQDQKNVLPQRLKI